MNTEKLYNIKNIYDLASGDHEFVKRLLTIFITETPDTIGDMIKAHKMGDAETIKRLAHRIKPSIKNLEINSILAPLNDIEQGTEPETNDQKLQLIANTLIEVVMGLKADLKEVVIY